MKRREEGTEGLRAVGRNRVKISSKVLGGQVEEEKDMGERCMEKTPAGTELRQDQAMLRREKRAMKGSVGKGYSSEMDEERAEAAKIKDEVGEKQRIGKGRKDGK